MVSRGSTRHVTILQDVICFTVVPGKRIGFPINPGGTGISDIAKLQHKHLSPWEVSFLARFRMILADPQLSESHFLHWGSPLGVFGEAFSIREFDDFPFFIFRAEVSTILMFWMLDLWIGRNRKLQRVRRDKKHRVQPISINFLFGMRSVDAARTEQHQ